MKQGPTRVVALVAVLVMAAGGWVECAGWQPAAEARMACCVEGDSCPMHKSATPGSVSTVTVSQAEADSCCAASESNDDSTPPAAALAMPAPAALLAAELFALVLPAALPRDSWRESIPIPGSQTPRHLLLAVFLI